MLTPMHVTSVFVFSHDLVSDSLHSVKITLRPTAAVISGCSWKITLSLMQFMEVAEAFLRKVFKISETHSVI